MGRANPKHGPRPGRVNPAEPSLSLPPAIAFSFKYLDRRKPFDVDGMSPAYFLILVDRLKSVCGMTTDEFRRGGKSLHSHQIDWNRTTRPDGFDCLNATFREQIADDCWQFSLSVNEHGRVHGFLIVDVFYVVWLDPTHALYE